MNIVAKIFTVLNLVVAIAFMIVSLTLYAKRIHWVEQAEKSIGARNSLNKEKLELEAELARKIQSTTVQIKDQEIVIEGLRETAESKAAELSRLALTNTKLGADITNISSQLKQIEHQIKQTQATNEMLGKEKAIAIKEKNKAEKEKEFAVSRSIEIMSDLEAAGQQLRQLAKNNSKLVGSVAQLNASLNKVSEEYNIDTDKIVPPAKAINGAVIRVEEAIGIVILNVGEKDSVKKGMEFVISDGDEYVGKVRVRNIYEDMCSASVITGVQKKPLQVNQTAQTL